MVWWNRPRHLRRTRCPRWWRASYGSCWLGPLRSRREWQERSEWWTVMSVWMWWTPNWSACKSRNWLQVETSNPTKTGLHRRQFVPVVWILSDWQLDSATISGTKWPPERPGWALALSWRNFNSIFGSEKTKCVSLRGQKWNERAVNSFTFYTESERISRISKDSSTWSHLPLHRVTLHGKCTAL